MKYSDVKNPVWANPQQTEIDCEVLFNNQTAYLPFTAVENGEPEYVNEIWQQCVAGQYGQIAPYQPQPPGPPPPPPTAEQNKQFAMQRLAETDWVNEPDVINTANQPHLLNQADFIAYRVAVRAIAVNPQPGQLVWPVKPQEQWSS